MKKLYKINSYNLYLKMASFEGDSETIWLDFENWKNDGAKSLEMMWKDLEWEYPAEASKVALLRSEKHTNRQESFGIITADQIRSDLDESF